MGTEQIITQEFFIKRFTNLILKSGLSGFPKDETDQHIFLKSIILILGKAEFFSEKEINERIQYWILAISKLNKMDHSTLRRWLVDTGYLTRTTDGSRYQIAPGSRAHLFDPAVEQIDIPQALQTAREEIEQRKKAFIEKKG
jgi:hypothetical protein